jgi:hydrogenase maturation protein HypF
VGLGDDGTLWGGEALLGEPGRWQRVASLRPFRLPGGERAALEPWRSALGLCWELDKAWEQAETWSDPVLREAWQRGLNCPVTTAIGRLFDAAAALTGVAAESTFEGQAPMMLEALCAEPGTPVALPLAGDDGGLWRSDWAPLLDMLMDGQEPAARRAERFHASLAQALVDQARAVRTAHGVSQVVLAGGVFQNAVLTGQAREQLVVGGFAVHIPCLLPVNDAGISYGQVVEAASRMRVEARCLDAASIVST